MKTAFPCVIIPKFCVQACVYTWQVGVSRKRFPKLSPSLKTIPWQMPAMEEIWPKLARGKTKPVWVLRRESAGSRSEVTAPFRAWIMFSIRFKWQRKLQSSNLGTEIYMLEKCEICWCLLLSFPQLSRFNTSPTDRGKDKQGRIPPILISGPGAEQFAKNNNISYREDLPIAEKALKVFKKYSKVIKRAAEKTNGPPEKIEKSCDTVGAVAMKIEKNDNNEEYSSDSVAASSSGGFVVKRNGRVGSAAHLGAGFWSQEDSCTTCSGCGEELIIHNTARLACSEEFLFDSHSIASNFPSSSNTGIELGFLKLLNDRRGAIELQYLHTTSDFMIGYVFLNPDLSDPDTPAYNCHHSENPKRGNSQYSSFRFSYSQD